jgi:hypothetical protein
MIERSTRAAAALAAALAAATGCGGPGSRAGGREPWAAVPALRVAVLVRDGDVESVRALGADEPFSATVSASERAGDAELWVLGYRAGTLRARFPGLPFDVAAWPALLVPRFDVGAPAPAADEVLRAPIDEGALAYATASWAAWSTSDGGAQGLRFEISDVVFCGGVTRRDASLPRDVAIDAIAVASSTSAVLVGAVPDVQVPTPFFVLEGDGVTPIAQAGPERGAVYRERPMPRPGEQPPKPLNPRLGWDARRGAAIGVDGRQQLFGVTRAGSRLRFPPLPPLDERPGAPAGEPSDLAAAPDGTIAALITQNVMRARIPIVHVLEDGAWRRATRFGEQLQLGLRVASHSRMLLYTACWVHANANADASEWKNAGVDPGCAGSLGGMVGSRYLNTVRDFDVDDRLAIAVGNQGLVTWSDARIPGEDAWQVLPFRNVDLDAVATAGGGDAVMVTSSGRILLLREQRECVLGELGAPLRAVGRADGVVMLARQPDPLQGVEPTLTILSFTRR